jgi:phosphoglycerate dehydrogenase-like enzyme
MVGICRNALNQIDIDAATAHGVAVTHAAGRNTNAVAELTMGFIVTLARHISDAHSMVRAGLWTDPAGGYRAFRGREVSGSTVGVVGFGKIGRAVARMALALGARVIAHDPVVPARRIRAAGAEPVALMELAVRADFVTLHVPADEGTWRLVGAPFLEAMHCEAFLNNTSDGAVVETGALVAALEARQIAGAALDVFEGQPLPASSPLLTAPNLILTPHIGGATVETVARQSRMMASEVERLLAGKPLRHLVNPEYEGARDP